jgi:DNA/RNA endonuclease YhcR with UshA esterase domain
LHNTPVLQKLNGQFPPGTVVFNCPQWNGVVTMYYTDYTCYDILPNEELLRVAQTQQRKVIVLDDGNLPEYVATHPTVTIVRNNLVRNGF